MRTMELFFSVGVFGRKSSAASSTGYLRIVTFTSTRPGEREREREGIRQTLVLGLYTCTYQIRCTDLLTYSTHFLCNLSLSLTHSLTHSLTLTLLFLSSSQLHFTMCVATTRTLQHYTNHYHYTANSKQASGHTTVYYSLG